MSFNPTPGMRIPLNGEEIVFAPAGTGKLAKVSAYAQTGREGTVYKVNKGDKPYALKVFLPNYQDDRLLQNTEMLGKLSDQEGLHVAQRTIITKINLPKVISQFPELEYAILMPWIQGSLWFNLMGDGSIIKGDDYLQIARSLLNVLSNLEIRKMAHCDLCHNNFVIGPSYSWVELVDIEDMYAPYMPRPVPDISYGTAGYRNSWIAEHGLWGPEGDRFATAILCAEILTWSLPEIRNGKYGETFFREDEIGETCDRFLLMVDCLSRYNLGLEKLFQRAWNSKELGKCPPIREWKDAVDKIQSTPSSKPLPQPNTKSPTTKEALTKAGKDGSVSHGAPPKMDISHTVLDFGIIGQSDEKIQFSLANTGASELNGSIAPQTWLDVAPSKFSIKPGHKMTFVISLRKPLPNTSTGKELRMPYAMRVESNAGTIVVGATYRLPPAPWYKKWLPMLILGFVGSISLLSIGRDIFPSIPSTTPSQISIATKANEIAPSSQVWQVIVEAADEHTRIMDGQTTFLPIEGQTYVELRLRIRATNSLDNPSINISKISIIDAKSASSHVIGYGWNSDFNLNPSPYNIPSICMENCPSVLPNSKASLRLFFLVDLAALAGKFILKIGDATPTSFEVQANPFY